MANKKITEATAKGALLATDRIPVGAVGDATAYYATGQDIVDLVGASGSGDFLADGSVPMTGPLVSDPGADDSALIFKIPVTSADGADFNFNIHRATFDAVEDVTFNWGFNNAVAGPVTTAKHAWYLQLEYDYRTGGNQYVEYHLNLYPEQPGAEGFRPFEYKYAKDGLSASLVRRGQVYQWQSLGGANTILSMNAQNTPEASTITYRAKTDWQLPAIANSFGVATIGAYTHIGIDGTTNDMTFRGRLLTFRDNDNNIILSSVTNNRFQFGGETSNDGMLSILQAAGVRGIAIRASAASIAPYIRFKNNATTQVGYVFLNGTNIEYAGVANTNYIIINSQKTTTGDPTGAEGLIYWNTIDNAIKMYADGAWRTLASW